LIWALSIKRLIIQQKYLFTEKATLERIADGLSEEDVLEAILNSTFVRSRRSRSPWRKGKNERIYIIESFTFNGVLVYTKGVIRRIERQETFYIFVSAKKWKSS
jgi:hypothetical protein